LAVTPLSAATESLEKQPAVAGALSLMPGQEHTICFGAPAFLSVDTGHLALTHAGRTVFGQPGTLFTLLPGSPTRIRSLSPCAARWFGTGGYQPVPGFSCRVFSCDLDSCLRASEILRAPVEVAGFPAWTLNISAAHGTVAPGAEQLHTGRIHGRDYALWGRPVSGAPLPRSVEVAVIGAGPAGVSVAAGAKARGWDYALLGEPFSFWKRNIVPRPLRSTATTTNLWGPGSAFTYKAFCRRFGLEPSGSIPFANAIAYLQHSLQAQEIDPYRMEAVDLRREGASWKITLLDGSEIDARNVVMAVGLNDMPNRPAPFQGLGGVCLHASEMIHFEGLHGKRVVVVGAGQSAVEAALEADRAGARTVLLVRGAEVVFRSLHAPASPTYKLLFKQSPRYFGLLPAWLQDPLLRILLKGTAEAGLREQLEHSGVQVETRAAIRECRLQTDGTVLAVSERGKTFRCDQILLGTGYRYDIRKLRMLDRVRVGSGLRARGGLPLLDRHAESSLPGLFFAGFSAMRLIGPHSQFIHGSMLITPRILERIAERASARR
jgi:NADPH-dependent 2,4-dienoyl-CoA reductase/sulfur reductase-like enzyme